MDGQRDDRLGRKNWLQLFQYRRQILRGRTESDTDANSEPYADSDSDCNFYSASQCETIWNAVAVTNTDSYYSHQHKRQRPWLAASGTHGRE